MSRPVDLVALRARIARVMAPPAAAPVDATATGTGTIDAGMAPPRLAAEAGQRGADDLGVAALRQALALRNRRTQAALATLPGEEVAYGVRLIESRQSFAQSLPERRPDWVRDDEECPRELVFVDTETSGLAGGTGTLVFLIGIGRVEGGELSIAQYLLTRPAAEAGMLDHVAAALPASPTWVSFNGRAFDVPLLATRQRMCRRCDVYTGRPHWDLLHPLRAAFAARWENCRLGTAEARLLGMTRDDDLPSALVPEAWRRWLHARDPQGLLMALAHHRQDIASLARLLVALDRVYADPEAHGADAEGIARRLSRLARERRRVPRAPDPDGLTRIRSRR
jgi:uncharacterized protein YprB with RNaseH-like and TPR domain